MQASPRRGRASAIQTLDLSGDGKKLQTGLAKLVLTIAELLKEVLERQAIRRVESGSLTAEEVERLGLAFMAIDKKLKEMSLDMGLKPEDLRAELASLVREVGAGGRPTDIVEVVDRLLDRGVAVAGQVRVSVADIDLIGLDLLAVLYPIRGKGASGGRR